MKYICWAVALVAILISACTGERDNGLISIEVRFEPMFRFQPMTMTPDIPLTVSEYRVYGSGPVSSSFELATGENSCVVDDLLPGEWTLAAEGFNSEGTTLFAGETTVILDEDISEVVIKLTEPEGEGTLQLTLGWESAFVNDPVINAVLTSSDGTMVSLNPTITDGAAVTDATLSAGLYDLTARLYDGDEHIAGAADYVKIIAGQETTGSIAFNFVLTPLSPGVILDSPYLTPLEVVIDGYESPLFTGTPATLRGVTGSEIISTYRWFVDGVPTATGAEYILDTTATVTKRIDLLAVSDGYASGGSATLEVSVHEPIFYGRLVFVESVFDNQGGADGLSDVRALAVWGDYLYSAGYGEDEVGVYEIAENAGKLAFLEVVSAGSIPELGFFDAPSCLVSGGNLAGTGMAGLATGCSGSGSLVLFGINQESGSLSLLDAVEPAVDDFAIPVVGPPDISLEANPLTGVAAIAATPGGSMIFASSAEGDTITSYTVTGGVVTPYQIISGGTLTAEGYDGSLLDGPEDIVVSTDGLLLAAVCRNSDSLLLFEIDETGGILTLIASFTDGVNGTDGLNGAAGVCFFPDGRQIYTTGYYDDAVALFEYDQITGAWLFIDVWKGSDLQGAALHYPRGVEVNPDGTELYVCASGSDSFTVFSREVNTGILSTPASALNGEDRNIGFDGIRKVAIAGGGDYVYTASSNDDAVALYRRE